MTRSQQADLESSREVLSYIPEARTEVARLWKDRFITKERRDFLNAFFMAAEEAGARLALRAGQVTSSRVNAR